MTLRAKDMYELLVNTLHDHYFQFANSLGLNSLDHVLSLNEERVSMDTRPPHFRNPIFKENTSMINMYCPHRYRLRTPLETIKIDIKYDIFYRLVEVLGMQYSDDGFINHARFPLNHPVVLTDPAHYFRLWLNLSIINRNQIFEETCLTPTVSRIMEEKRNLVGSALMHPLGHSDHPLFQLPKEILQNQIDINAATEMIIPQNIYVYSAPTW